MSGECRKNSRIAKEWTQKKGVRIKLGIAQDWWGVIWIGEEVWRVQEKTKQTREFAILGTLTRTGTNRGAWGRHELEAKGWKEQLLWGHSAISQVGRIEGVLRKSEWRGGSRGEGSEENKKGSAERSWLSKVINSEIGRTNWQSCRRWRLWKGWSVLNWNRWH